MLEENQIVLNKLEALRKIKNYFENILECEYLSDEDKESINPAYIKIGIQYEVTYTKFDFIQDNCKHDFKYYCGGHKDNIYICIKCGKVEFKNGDICN